MPDVSREEGIAVWTGSGLIRKHLVDDDNAGEEEDDDDDDLMLLMRSCFP